MDPADELAEMRERIAALETEHRRDAEALRDLLDQMTEMRNDFKTQMAEVGGDVKAIQITLAAGAGGWRWLAAMGGIVVGVVGVAYGVSQIWGRFGH